MGDFIIIDAVKEQLFELFQDSMFFHTLTHDRVSLATYKLNWNSSFSFVGGTNLLSSNMHFRNQWKINLVDSVFLNNIILMGVGWWQYQKKPNMYTRLLLRSVLSNRLLHSVRDRYTETMLKAMGIDNVVNTGCPTMWGLTPAHCAKVPRRKGKSVVFTLTDYNRDYEKDKMLIEVLLRNYKVVYFWPQGSKDYEYIQSFEGGGGVRTIGANVFSYNRLLDDKDVSLDYIGTRLHAGIRALQKGRRSIIIGIDNRATEKSKDFNLKVLSRERLQDLDSWLNDDFETDILLNEKEIVQWKNQFS